MVMFIIIVDDDVCDPNKWHKQFNRMIFHVLHQFVTGRMPEDPAARGWTKHK
jgi:hypothetical protein